MESFHGITYDLNFINRHMRINGQADNILRYFIRYRKFLFLTPVEFLFMNGREVVFFVIIFSFSRAMASTSRESPNKFSSIKTEKSLYVDLIPFSIF